MACQWRSYIAPDRLPGASPYLAWLLNASCTGNCTARAPVAASGAPETGQEDPQSSIHHGICWAICPGPTMDPESPSEAIRPRTLNTSCTQDQVNVGRSSSKSAVLSGQVRGSPVLPASSRSTGLCVELERALQWQERQIGEDVGQTWRSLLYSVLVACRPGAIRTHTDYHSNGF